VARSPGVPQGDADAVPLGTVSAGEPSRSRGEQGERWAVEPWLSLLGKRRIAAKRYFSLLPVKPLVQFLVRTRKAGYSVLQLEFSTTEVLASVFGRAGRLLLRGISHEGIREGTLPDDRFPATAKQMKGRQGCVRERRSTCLPPSVSVAFMGR